MLLWIPSVWHYLEPSCRKVEYRWQCHCCGLSSALEDRTGVWCEPLPAPVYWAGFLSAPCTDLTLGWAEVRMEMLKNRKSSSRPLLIKSSGSRLQSWAHQQIELEVLPRNPCLCSPWDVAQVPWLSRWHLLFHCTRCRIDVTARKKPMNCHLFIGSLCTSKTIMHLDKLCQVKMHSLAMSLFIWWKLLE